MLKKDSFGIYVEFRAKLYKAIFGFTIFIFILSVSENMLFLTFDLQLEKK